jgi:hypothetical protein
MPGTPLKYLARAAAFVFWTPHKAVAYLAAVGFIAITDGGYFAPHRPFHIITAGILAALDATAWFLDQQTDDTPTEQTPTA